MFCGGCCGCLTDRREIRGRDNVSEVVLTLKTLSTKSEYVVSNGRAAPAVGNVYPCACLERLGLINGLGILYGPLVRDACTLSNAGQDSLT